MARTKASNLIQDGQPKYIRIYKLRGSAYDPWTVVFTKVNCWVSDDKETKRRWLGRLWYLDMTESGAVSHGEFDTHQYGRPNFGSVKSWGDLNAAQKAAVIDEYEACWGIRVIQENGRCVSAEYKD